MSQRRKMETALSINVTAARSLQEMLKTNLGPKGTMKMLVSEAGDIKLTKCGGALLQEMRLQHPTALFITQAVAAMNDTVGDGTTSSVLLIGEMLKQAERYISEGVHPRHIVKGLEMAKVEAIYCLDELWEDEDHFIRRKVARTSLGTKVCPELAEILTDLVVEAVAAVSQRRKPIDLKHVELMTMQLQTEQDTMLVRGLVLDHGARHPGMRRRVQDAFILTLNVALEYERSTVSSSCFYRNVEERERFVKAERQAVQEKLEKIIMLKREVCSNSNKGFVVVNQKSIDPMAFSALAGEGIVALRRAKKSNMERLPLACGGQMVSSLQDLNAKCLGHAGLVYQETLGENTYTFIEQCDNPRAVTVVIKGLSKHTIAQVKEAVQYGMRAVKNCIEDGSAMPGAGAVEMRIRNQLINHRADKVKGAARLGFQAFADAFLIIPKTLAQNAGYDPQEMVSKALMAEEKTTIPVGIDLSSGGLIADWDTPVWDNSTVKHQLIHTCTSIVTNILLVDEIIGTGKALAKTPVDRSR